MNVIPDDCLILILDSIINENNDIIMVNKRFYNIITKKMTIDYGIAIACYNKSKKVTKFKCRFSRVKHLWVTKLIVNKSGFKLPKCTQVITWNAIHPITRDLQQKINDNKLKLIANSDTMFRNAVIEDNIKLTELCLKYKLYPVSQCAMYKSVQHAITNDRIHMLNLLLEYGENLSDIRNKAFHYACEFGYTNIVKVLLQNITYNFSKEYSEALRSAVRNNNKEIVKLLLETEKVSLSKRNYEMIRIAFNKEDDDILKMLIKYPKNNIDPISLQYIIKLSEDYRKFKGHGRINIYWLLEHVLEHTIRMK